MHITDMPLDILAVHIILAIWLFLAMNWVGRHTVLSFKYFQITYFDRNDDAPAFNIVFRVLAPVVFIIISGAFLHALGLPRYVQSIYLVAVYHQAIRWAFVLVAGRRLLVRWTKQYLTAAAAIGLSVIAYNQLISHPTRLLPSLDTLSNELWLIVLLFLYRTFDQVDTATSNEAQKLRYLAHRYDVTSRRFGQLIAAHTPNRQLHPLVYAVMIYETFNRPYVWQLLERAVPAFGKIRSFGPMQVQSPHRLSDAASIRLGTQKLVNAYQAHYKTIAAEYSETGSYVVQQVHRRAARQAAQEYNTGSDYADQVMAIHDDLVRCFYSDLSA